MHGPMNVTFIFLSRNSHHILLNTPPPPPPPPHQTKWKNKDREKSNLTTNILYKVFFEILRSTHWTWCLFEKKSKVKCTLVQALRLCTGRTARRGSRGIALLFLDHGPRREWGVSVTPWPLFTPGKDPIPIIKEAWWAPGSVWTGAENLAPTGIRSPDRPAHSQSLYRLCYPAHQCLFITDISFGTAIQLHRVIVN